MSNPLVRPGQIARADPKHINGTATGTAAAVDLTKDGNGHQMPDWIYIQTTGSDDLLVSWDGGTTFVTVPAISASISPSFEMYDPGKTITLKADGTTSAYEIVATYRRFKA